MGRRVEVACLELAGIMMCRSLHQPRRLDSMSCTLYRCADLFGGGTVGRKSKRDETGVAMAGIAAALLVALFILYATAVFGGVIVLLGLVYFEFRVRDNFEVPKVDDFDSPQASADLAVLESRWQEFHAARKAVYDHGHDRGVELRKKNVSDGPRRFDQRNKMGKTLNDALDSVEHDMQRLSHGIEKLKYKVTAYFPRWEEDYDKWCFDWSGSFAFRSGAEAYALIAGIAWLTCTIRSHQQGLMVPILIGTTVATTVVIGLSWHVKYRELQAAIDVDRVTEWNNLRGRWDPSNLSYQHTTPKPSASDAGAERASRDDVRDRVRSPSNNANNDVCKSEWWAVLGVTPTATLEEIKAAKQRLVWQYHPDRLAGVVGLGPMLINDANQHLAQVNIAYAQALDALKDGR